MTLPRAEVVAGTLAELRAFADLVENLDLEEWQSSTRCAGWTVGDIAAHVSGFVSDVSAGRFHELAAPGAQERQVSERRGRSPAETAVELRRCAEALSAQLEGLDDLLWDSPAPAGVAPTIGFGVEHIWYDAYVHADDIRDALGRPSDRGAGLRAAVSHLAGLLSQHHWAPQSLELSGFEPIPIGGEGEAVVADPLAFVLVATGRAHPLEIGSSGRLNIYAT